MAAVDIELTDFSSSDEGAASTILTAMISCVQSYGKLPKIPGILVDLECDDTAVHSALSTQASFNT